MTNDVSLEDPTTNLFCATPPIGFIAKYAHGVDVPTPTVPADKANVVVAVVVAFTICKLLIDEVALFTFNAPMTSKAVEEA